MNTNLSTFPLSSTLKLQDSIIEFLSEDLNRIINNKILNMDSQKFLFNHRPGKFSINEMCITNTEDVRTYTITPEDLLAAQIRVRRLYLSLTDKERLESYGIWSISFGCSTSPTIVNIHNVLIEDVYSFFFIMVNEILYVFNSNSNITTIPENDASIPYTTDDEVFAELSEFFSDYTGTDIFDILEN